MKNLSDIVRQDRAAAEQRRIERQLACKHEGAIFEHPHNPSPYSHTSTPSWRVCEHCGFCEYGWGDGHQILAGPCDIDAAAARYHRVGKIHKNDGFVTRASDPRTVAELYTAAVREPSKDD